MDEVHRRIGRRIREIAEERGIPLTHMADRCKVGRSHLFEVLAGRRSPTVAWLVRIARVLQVDVSELLSPRRRPKPAGKAKKGRTHARGTEPSTASG